MIYLGTHSLPSSKHNAGGRKFLSPKATHTKKCIRIIKDFDKTDNKIDKIKHLTSKHECKAKI